MFAFGSLLNGDERTIDLNFVAQTGYPSTLTGRLSGSTPSTATSHYTGTAAATVRFDTITLQPSEISFTGGRFFIEDFVLAFSGNAFVPGYGNFLTYITVHSTDAQEYLSTPDMPGAILADGSLVVSQHRLTADRGLLTVSASVPSIGAFESDTTNFAQTPETTTLSGSATLSIIEESSNALERTLLFVLDWEDSTYESELIEDTTTSIILEGTKVDP